MGFFGLVVFVFFFFTDLICQESTFVQLTHSGAQCNSSQHYLRLQELHKQLFHVIVFSTMSVIPDVFEQCLRHFWYFLDMNRNHLLLFSVFLMKLSLSDVQRNSGNTEIIIIKKDCAPCSSMKTSFKPVSKTDFCKAVRKTNISSAQNIYFSRFEECLTLFHTKDQA